MSFNTAHVEPVSTIHSYHAHIYFKDIEQREIAEQMRTEIAQRFSVLIGRLHDRPIGPHERPMYQVAFASDEFARFVPWLMINRRGLTVLIHPNTGRPRRDHLFDAMWLGEVLDIHNLHLLPQNSEPEPDIIPNTLPSLEP